MNTNQQEKMTFAELVTSSVLARGLSLLILAFALMGAIAVALIDLLFGRTPPQVLIDFIFMGITAALTVTGISFGVVLQPSRGALPVPTAPLAPPDATSSLISALKMVPSLAPLAMAMEASAPTPTATPTTAPAGPPATANN